MTITINNAIAMLPLLGSVQGLIIMMILALFHLLETGQLPFDRSTYKEAVISGLAAGLLSGCVTLAVYEVVMAVR